MTITTLETSTAPAKEAHLLSLVKGLSPEEALDKLYTIDASIAHKLDTVRDMPQNERLHWVELQIIARDLLIYYRAVDTLI